VTGNSNNSVNWALFVCRFFTAARASRKACLLSFLCFAFERGLFLALSCVEHRGQLGFPRFGREALRAAAARTHTKRHGMACFGGVLIGWLDASQLHQTTFFVFWNLCLRIDWMLGLLLAVATFFLTRNVRLRCLYSPLWARMARCDYSHVQILCCFGLDWLFS